MVSRLLTKEDNGEVIQFTIEKDITDNSRQLMGELLEKILRCESPSFVEYNYVRFFLAF